MPISIKNPQTEELARKLAKETGETITEVIKKCRTACNVFGDGVTQEDCPNK